LARPSVTIIVNVFNGARFVREAMESIRALEGGFAPQVLVTDDASQDATPQVLADYADFEVVRLERNVGAAAAISLAFERVRGEYVARLDYDDRLRPHFLASSIAALQRWPDAAFVCASAQMIDEDGAPAGLASPTAYGETPGCRDRFASMLKRHFVTAPTILGRTGHWRRAMPVPAGMNFCDWYMNLTMAETAPVAVIDEVTADYRLHPLNMHVTKVRDGMGERVTRQVLDRFLGSSPRAAELAPQARAIRAHHAADWGDRYFGAGMNEDARRCYTEAIRCDLGEALRSKFLHRYVGLVIGRPAYDSAKRAAQLLTSRLPA
jgi:glycosyltransferase involved in cell wall biosynthesis